MIDPSDERRRALDASGGATAEEVDAEERATGEGMPEPPGAPSKAEARTEVIADEEQLLPPDPGLHGRVTVDDYQEDDGGYDLGGEA